MKKKSPNNRENNMKINSVACNIFKKTDVTIISYEFHRILYFNLKRGFQFKFKMK